VLSSAVVVSVLLAVVVLDPVWPPPDQRELVGTGWRELVGTGWRELVGTGWRELVGTGWR
jgi:hypothetical protein